MLFGMSEVTQILAALESGDSSAGAELLPLVYDELRRLAAVRLSNEPLGQTLQPTALVHEAYLRLVGSKNVSRWDSRGHFFAAAAEAMRRILVDAARRKNGPEHGGGYKRCELDPEIPAPPDRPDRLLALDEALDRFAVIEPRAAEVVKLRFFAGLSVAETAAALSISPRTADNDWAYARAWLVADFGAEA
jgi:RNA polymerase sigma factor (TIGR02999 family)